MQNPTANLAYPYPCLRALLIQKDAKPGKDVNDDAYSLRALLIQKDAKQRKKYDLMGTSLRALLIQKDAKRVTNFFRSLSV